MDPIREFRFSDEELKADIARATALFVKRVRKDVPAAYGPKLAEAQKELAEALRLTSDLTDLRPEIIAANPGIVRALRYAAGPPISEEDFRTVTGWPFTPTPNAKVVRAVAPAVCDTARELADRLLFPWLDENRGPTPKERQAAINGTAKLLAVERFRTERRGGASKEQEAEVRRVLAAEADLTEV